MPAFLKPFSFISRTSCAESSRQIAGGINSHKIEHAGGGEGGGGDLLALHAVEINSLLLVASSVSDDQIRVVVMNPFHFGVAVLFPLLIVLEKLPNFGILPLVQGSSGARLKATVRGGGRHEGGAGDTVVEDGPVDLPAVTHVRGRKRVWVRLVGVGVRSAQEGDTGRKANVPQHLHKPSSGPRQQQERRPVKRDMSVRVSLSNNMQPAALSPHHSHLISKLLPAERIHADTAVERAGSHAQPTADPCADRSIWLWTVFS